MKGHEQLLSGATQRVQAPWNHERFQIPMKQPTSRDPREQNQLCARVTTSGDCINDLKFINIVFICKDYHKQNI